MEYAFTDYGDYESEYYGSAASSDSLESLGNADWINFQSPRNCKLFIEDQLRKGKWVMFSLDTNPLTQYEKFHILTPPGM